MSTRPLLADDDAELLDITGMIIKQTEPDLEPVVAKSVKEALEILNSEENDFDKTYIQGITRLVAKLAERMKQAVSDMHSGTLIQK